MAAPIEEVPEAGSLKSEVGQINLPTQYNANAYKASFTATSTYWRPSTE
jgi:hypothetical protein